jgi:hypothetical protein
MNCFNQAKDISSVLSLLRVIDVCVNKCSAKSIEYKEIDLDFCLCMLLVCGVTIIVQPFQFYLMENMLILIYMNDIMGL